MTANQDNSQEKLLFTAVSEQETATVSGGQSNGIQPGDGSNVPGKKLPGEVKLYATGNFPFLISVYLDEKTGQAKVVMR